MKGAAPEPAPRRYGFVLVPQFSTIGFAAAIEPLRLANLASARTLYRTCTSSVDGASGSTCGAMLAPAAVRGQHRAPSTDRRSGPWKRSHG